MPTSNSKSVFTSALPTKGTPTELTNEAIFTTPMTAIYIGICVVVSIVIAVLIFWPLGYSARSDRVFGLEVMIAGVIGDWLYRRIFRRRMTVLPRVDWPAYLIWLVLGGALAIGAFSLKASALELDPQQGIASEKLVAAVQPPVCSPETSQRLAHLVLTASFFPERLSAMIQSGALGPSPDPVAACARLLSRFLAQVANSQMQAQQALPDRAYQIGLSVEAHGGPPGIAGQVRDKVQNTAGQYALLSIMFDELTVWYPAGWSGNWAPFRSSTLAQQAALVQQQRTIFRRNGMDMDSITQQSMNAVEPVAAWVYFVFGALAEQGSR
jgi:hypothetical protein